METQLMSALSHDSAIDRHGNDYDYDLDEFQDRARVAYNRTQNLPDDYGKDTTSDYDPDDYSDPDEPRGTGWRYVRPDALTRERDCPGCGDCRAGEREESESRIINQYVG
jgi:hypothetical protein